jgi:aryl-alcohol dehydrogenase-like predicted oxidoreductase
MKKNQREWCGKFVLGTVQFGLDYGVSNSAGKIPPAEVARILTRAGDSGVGGLDTAAAYGSSEEVIGECLKQGGSFNIISKLPGGLTGDEFMGSLDQSLQRLGVERLEAYLVHAPAEMLRPEVQDFLIRARGEGKVKKVGVSVYRIEEVELLWADGIEFDVLQIPFNVFDQRFAAVFAELRARKVEVHARSVFLQGLLFMTPEELPEHFASVRNPIAALHELAETAGLSLSSLLLNFAMAQRGIDRVLVGVAGLGQLQENLEAFDDFGKVAKLLSKLENLSISDENIVLPTNWS